MSADPILDLLAASIERVAALNAGDPERYVRACIAWRAAALEVREAAPWWARFQEEAVEGEA